ncbi:YaaL family protein [Oscillibacter sp. MSJ-2]|uniref:YaaL family protein n=1 Tax=Dysosmobacter acutus TaxID=2841504 RepID=A0ABS6F6R0_9FIRM|nr:YaaL family protein [Dysosmobacter acutus]
MVGKKSARTPEDARLNQLRSELNETQLDLALAYRQFDMVVDPELVESCIYQINALKARYNYLIRVIKEQRPAAAAAARTKGAAKWI